MDEQARRKGETVSRQVLQTVRWRAIRGIGGHARGVRVAALAAAEQPKRGASAAFE
jgi:hypothetical protein